MKLLSLNPQKTPLVQKVQNCHIYFAAKHQPEKLADIMVLYLQ